MPNLDRFNRREPGDRLNNSDWDERQDWLAAFGDDETDLEDCDE
jgi:hypothetical protein